MGGRTQQEVVQLRVPFEGGAAGWIVLRGVRGKGAGRGRVSRGRWQEPAGAGGEEILPRAEPPRCSRCKTSGTWPAAVFHLVPTQLFVFFFLMYCQYFKTGRFFFLTRIFRLSLKSPKLWLHRVSLPPGTWRGHLSCLCPHHEGHVSSFLQALVS